MREACTRMTDIAKCEVDKDHERYFALVVNEEENKRKELMNPISKTYHSSKNEERRVPEKLELMQSQMTLVMQSLQRAGMLNENEVKIRLT